MRRILAIGGGGFLMEDVSSPIDKFIVQVTGKLRPRICYIGTPNGDMPDGIEKFYAAFPTDRCEPSHLAFFRKPSSGSIPLANYRQHLLNQDAIFVAGGSTKSALGVWREWGLNDVFAEAYLSGVLLCGMSAGALCWFNNGITDSFWGGGYKPLPCLGLLSGGCTVHYNSDPLRRPGLHAAIETGAISSAVAIDDYSAVLYEDDVLTRVYRWGTGAGAYFVKSGGGICTEVLLDSVQI